MNALALKTGYLREAESMIEDYDRQLASLKKCAWRSSGVLRDDLQAFVAVAQERLNQMREILVTVRKRQANAERKERPR